MYSLIHLHICSFVSAKFWLMLVVSFSLPGNRILIVAKDNLLSVGFRPFTLMVRLVCGVWLLCNLYPAPPSLSYSEDAKGSLMS